MQEDLSEEQIFLNNLGNRIITIREQKGLSSAETARRMYMDSGNYTRIETGKTNPTAKTLFKLSKVLNCEIIDFFKSGNQG